MSDAQSALELAIALGELGVVAFEIEAYLLHGFDLFVKGAPLVLASVTELTILLTNSFKLPLSLTEIVLHQSDALLEGVISGSIQAFLQLAVQHIDFVS